VEALLGIFLNQQMEVLTGISKMSLLTGLEMIFGLQMIQWAG
jgi:hypothetical protein